MKSKLSITSLSMILGILIIGSISSLAATVLQEENTDKVSSGILRQYQVNEKGKKQAKEATKNSSARKALDNKTRMNPNSSGSGGSKAVIGEKSVIGEKGVIGEKSKGAGAKSNATSTKAMDPLCCLERGTKSIKATPNPNVKGKAGAASTRKN